MSTMEPHGKVLSGKFAGKNVYVWAENQSLMIFDGVLSNGAFSGSSPAQQLSLIDPNTVSSFQDMGKVEESSNLGAVANATFWFGVGGGILASQLSKSNSYLVAVEYVNGEKSLLQLNGWAYQTFAALSFSIATKSTQASTTIISEESHIKKDHTITTPQIAQKNIDIDANNISASLIRIQLFIEDEEWERAKEYCEAVLDVSPMESDVYLYTILIDNRLQSLDQLKDVSDLVQNKSFAKALRFAHGARKDQLEALLKSQNIATTNIVERYSPAIQLLDQLNRIAGFGFMSIWITEDGKIKTAGRNLDKKLGLCDFGGWSDMIAISAGSYHVVGLKSDGTVLATGDNQKGQCNVEKWREIIAVSAGFQHTLGLKADGTVIATGDNSKEQCNAAKWIDIKKIHAAGNRSYAINTSGKVFAEGELESADNTIINTSDVTSLGMQSGVRVAVKKDDTVIAAGTVLWLGTPDSKPAWMMATEKNMLDVQQIKNAMVVKNSYLLSIFLLKDGRVTARGGNDNGIRDIPEWRNTVAIGTGAGHFLGINANGELLAYGDNTARDTKVELVNGRPQVRNVEEPSGQCNVGGYKSFNNLEEIVAKIQNDIASIKQKAIEAAHLRGLRLSELKKEKDSIINEITSINNEYNEKIQILKNKINSIHEQSEYEKYEIERNQLFGQKNALGLFKGKEKKELDIRIQEIEKQMAITGSTITSKIKEIEAAVASIQVELRNRTLPLEKRISDIEEEQSMIK